MKKFSFLIILVPIIFLLFSSCQDENNTPDTMDPIPIDTMQIDFGCIYEFDTIGVAINNCNDDEWQLDLDFSEDELGYLDFGDTLDFQGASVGILSEFKPYPNPASGDIYFNYTIDQDAYFKIVFIDENYDRKFLWHGLLTEDVNTFGLNISGLEDQDFRIYYSFSAEGNEDFAGGFGDIRIQN